MKIARRESYERPMTHCSAETLVLLARRTGFFGRECEIVDEAGGRAVTRIACGWPGRSGSFELDGRSYSMRRTSWFAHEYALEAGGHRIALAASPAFLSRDLEVSWGGRTTRLDKRAFSHTFDVIHHSRAVGTIRPGSWLLRAATLTMDEAVPVELAVFFLWLVLEHRSKSH